VQTVATPLRHRRVLVVSGLAALLVLTALVSLAVGARPIGVGAVWQALWTPSGTEEDVIVRCRARCSASPSGSRWVWPER
jgi:iron complex transport system permease protein